MILHEEAEDGNAMPDLARPVQAVKLAVDNLIKVIKLSNQGLDIYYKGYPILDPEERPRGQNGNHK